MITLYIINRLTILISIKLLNTIPSDNVFVFEVECSKGTYIRSLCEDIAEKLGTVGYMKELERVVVRRFFN